MWTQISVLAVAAVLTAGAAFWALRAYRRAGGGANSPLPALSVCGAVAAVALGIYLFLGNPELPDAPYAARLETLKGRDPTTFTAEEALAILNQAAREHPGDPMPYFYTGQLMLSQGRAEEAARAFDMALRREPRMAEAVLGLGRAIVAAEGRVTPEALAAFQQAGTLTNDPAPWIYQAMAAMEEGRDVDARALWGEAYARMREDDPRREMARRMSAGEGVE